MTQEWVREALNGKQKENKAKSHYFICRLMYTSKKPDNSSRFHRTKERKMTPFLQRKIEQMKNNLSEKQKAGLLMETVIEVLEGESSPSTNQSSMSFWAFTFEFSTFLLPLHYSLVLSLPLHLLLTPSAIFISLSSLCPFPPLSSLLLFRLCWIPQSIFAPLLQLPHFCSLTPPHLCQGIDLDPCSHEGDVTRTSNTYNPLSSPWFPTFHLPEKALICLQQ